MVFFTDCQFLENHAEKFHGGALVNYSSTMVINTSAVADNIAGSSGVGVFALSEVRVSHSSVLNNAAELGGGIYSAADKAQLSNTTVSGNRARQSGGRVFLEGYRDSYR